MRVVEARSAWPPDPEPLPDAAWRRVPGESRRVVPGVDSFVAAAAEHPLLYSELGAPWAQRTEHPRYEVSTR